MLRLFKYTFLTRAWPTWARYFATFLIVLATLVARVAVESWIPGSPLNEVALVRRSAAMRFLSEQKTEAAQSRFGLQNLGYHCTAEHVAHAVGLALIGAAGSE